MFVFLHEQYENSIKVFQAYQKEFGFNFEAERYVSISYYSMNKLNEAEKSLQYLCSSQPNDSSIWYDRAIVLETMNRNIDAIHCYLKTLELEPDFNDAFTRLAAVYHKEGKLYELIEVYEAAQVAEENKHIHFSFLAQAYLLDGKKDKAINYINNLFHSRIRMILRIRDI